MSLAQRAVELSKGGDPAILDVLAAAYAESGNYAKASETDRRALELTAKQNQAGLSRTLQDRIALYDSGKPFRTRQ